ncbi:MAG: HD-GYP domain-containing protein, partial [Geminicoccaceae bacterium]
LDLAASLSQIGKIFIPHAILTKPGRHSEAEARAMRGHVAHALAVLAPIDFDLPVAAAIGQMYERLDGSGYPAGLKGAQIGLLARVLGAADAFCALSAPRSYRDQLGTQDALAHLVASPHLYDAAVILTLGEVVAAQGDARRKSAAGAAA